MDAHSTTRPDNDLPLWDYACTVYARPGMRETCLHWQTRYHADIPLVLALCWQAARRHVQPDPAGLSAFIGALEPWRTAVVLRLRALRTRLKPLSPPRSRCAQLRATILAAELQAERVELEYLARVLPRTPATHAPAEGARQVLECYLTQLGVSHREGKRAVATLLRYLGVPAKYDLETDR